jgi:two-component system response regulator AlgR
MATEPILRTIIVDDEPLAIDRLRMMCDAISSLRTVGTALDADAALALIESEAPDLLLLDIAMPGMDGMRLARLLDERTARPLVIFTTAYDHHALEAFEVAAVDYLLKPIALDRLRRAIERAREARPRAPSTGPLQELWVPHRSEMVRIETAAIEWIEAERDYMRLHLGSRSYLLHMTITALEQRLDPAGFVRLHRSAIVRRDLIERFQRDRAGSWTAILRDGRAMRVGRSYLGAARAMTAR